MTGSAPERLREPPAAPPWLPGPGPIVRRLTPFPTGEVVGWAESVLALSDRMNAVDRPAGHEEVGGDYGAYRYAIGDRTLAEAALGEDVVARLADRARAEAEATLQRTVYGSPHRRSACTAKVFRAGDYQGWHLDTNPIAVLVYLTGVGARHGFAGGDLLAVDLLQAPSVERHRPQAGDVVLIEGARAWHGVTPVTAGTRVTLGFNLYLTPGEPRPPSVDDWIFGESDR